VTSAGLAPRKRKVIIEDDASGFHAAQAMLLQAEGVEVLGLAATSGNAWRDEALDRVRRTLEILGRTDVPALPGAVFPLLNSEAATERWETLYGKLVWKGAWTRARVEPTDESGLRYHAHDIVTPNPLGSPSVVMADERLASLFMIEMTNRYPGEVTIMATGPLTSVALAQSLDPGFAERVEQLVYMGGSLSPRQRLTGARAAQFAREYAHSPRREFNIRWDPEAARIVMRAPFPRITMIPIDPSTATEFTPALHAAFAAVDTPIARAMSWTESGQPLWDEIASAVWLEPHLATRTEEAFVDVNTEFGAGYGDTLSWAPGYEPGLGERLQTVVLDVDVKGVEALLVELLTAERKPAVGAPVPWRY